MEGGSAFASVLRLMLALAGVSGLAWAVLALLARRGLWTGAPRGARRVRVLERIALSPRRQLYLVQADARVFLLGAGEAGPPALIAELEAEPQVEAVS
ncbi:MAG TPA: flagellar biosynthetic protein FliO [Polyangiales bacterium]|nr:flagellar biosynthetic protein FliO [Polyangiales bacterium]